MLIKTEALEAFTILHVLGELDALEGRQLLQEIEQLRSEGVNRVALNLSQVRFIGSSALGAILRAGKSLTADRGRLVVSHPSLLCREIMDKVGLERAVAIFASDEEAGRALVA